MTNNLDDLPIRTESMSDFIRRGAEVLSDDALLFLVAFVCDRSVTKQDADYPTYMNTENVKDELRWTKKRAMAAAKECVTAGFDLMVWR